MSISSDSYIDKGNFINQDISLLSERFLRGDTLTFELSEYVFNNIAGFHEGGYKAYIAKVKDLLNSVKISFCSNMVLIETDSELSNEERIIATRYINMCHKNNKYIILVNTEIIYLPKELINRYGVEAMRVYANFFYRAYVVKRKIKDMLDKFNIKRLMSFLH